MRRAAVGLLVGLLVVLVGGSCGTPDFKGLEEVPTEAGPDDPITAQCENNKRDGDETDTDCGGSCPPCTAGRACTARANCRDTDCIKSVCQNPGCTDGELGGTETDLDCGGGQCPPCDPGLGCQRMEDCVSGVCDAMGFCAEPTCDDRVRNSSETDVDCGGRDCPRCDTGRGCALHGDCLSNTCGPDGRCIVSCPDGLDNCDGKAENECETNIRADAAHCGGCGLACTLKNAMPECSGGVCRITECIPPFEDCDGDPENGCETNTKNDVKNCGTCGEVCIGLNGQPYCSESSCEIVCDTGFGDCDELRSNGCEKDVKSDVKNCGGCGDEGQVCASSSGNTPWCRDGMCGETKCPSGFGDCNGNPDDGCETNLRTDRDNCGSCGNLCVAANGTAFCDDGMCAIQSCREGYADCSGGYADGCEVNLNTSAAHCGGCRKPCIVANGEPLCETGLCAIKTCNTNYEDCNDEVSDGCEINLSTSNPNCGECGNDCGTAYDNASASCASGTCSLTTCNVPFGNCNSGLLDGCETNTETAPSHCGGCGKVCSTDDAAHVTSNACAGGTCGPVCSTGYDNCDNNGYNGCEANITNTSEHCGGCGKACAITNATSTSCSSSKCNPACMMGYGNCDNNGHNGCETNITDLPDHCGGCGKVCSTVSAAHVTSNTCSSGICDPVCATGYLDCDDDGHNGCEAVLNARQHCGGCNKECSIAGTAHVTSNDCSGGSCNPVCASGYANCDGDDYNGCETELWTTSNCTSCDDACSGSKPNCSPSGCVAACATAYVRDDCLSYDLGTKVSRNGRNYTCSNAQCRNCSGYTSCEPGETGCPWGGVWTDNGVCG